MDVSKLMALESLSLLKYSVESGIPFTAVTRSGVQPPIAMFLCRELLQRKNPPLQKVHLE